VVTPLVLSWLALTLVLGVALGAIVLVQFTLAHVRPARQLTQPEAAAPEQDAQPAAAQAA
jgi:hypothetical protein